MYALRILILMSLVGLVSGEDPSTKSSPTKLPAGEVLANKSQPIKEVRCSAPEQNKVCLFLAANYDEVRARCGITASRRLKSKLLFWGRQYQPIDSVPNNVFYGIDASTFRDDRWVGEDPGTTSLGRMLSVAFFPDSGKSCLETKEDTFIENLHKADSSDWMLQFDPLLGPELSLVAGESRVIDTMTCSDVTEALQSANFAISSAGASNKITVRNNSNVRYKLVYGMFRSPLSYVSGPARTTYFLEAADWYMRHPDGENLKAACFVSSLRGLAVYDEFGSQSEIGSAIRGGGQFANLLVNIQASASNQQSTETNNSSLSFRNLVHRDIQFGSLPSWQDTVRYLSGNKIAYWLPDAKFDPQTKRVIATVVIDGVMPNLCPTTNQPGIAWTMIQVKKLPNGCLSNTGVDPLIRIDKIEFVAPGKDLLIGPGSTAGVPTATSRCKFTVSVPLTSVNERVQASFDGWISPSAPQPNDCSIGIPVSSVQTFESPTLRSLGKSTNESFAGVWYQLQDSAQVLDLSKSPMNNGLASNCSNAIVTVENGFPTKTSSIDGTYIRVNGLDCDHPSGNVTFYLQGTGDQTLSVPLPSS